MSLEKVKLDNGLTVYNDRIPGARTNNVTMFIPYGSVNERPGDEGVAHVFEHCVFLGTDRFKNDTQLDEFDSRHGLEVNAATYYTSTVYYAHGMELKPNMVHLSQLVQHPHFPKGKVKHELKAVRREMTSTLDDIDELHAVAANLAMFGAPYGRNIGGHHDRINFDNQILKDLHAKYYKLGRMSLVVTGAAKLEDVARLAEQYFQADADPTFTEEVAPINALGKDLRTGLIYNGTQNVRARVSHPMTPEFRDYLNSNRLVVGMALSAIASATFTALRHTEGLSYDGGADINSDNHPNAWSIIGDVTTDPKKVGRALDIFSMVFECAGKRYSDKKLTGILAAAKYGINSVITSHDAHATNIVNYLDECREPVDMEAVIHQLDTIDIADIREAIDEVITFVGSTDRYVHLTGSKKGIGKVDRVIGINEIA